MASGARGLLRALIAMAAVASVLSKEVLRSSNIHCSSRHAFRPHVVRRVVSQRARAEDDAANGGATVVRVGFIGTGTIAEAVATGMLSCSHPLDLHVTVSPRNAERAARLAAKFPSKVSIAADNQAVVDSSDVVCVSVVPSVVDTTLQGLTFRQDHKVVSFVSTASVEDLRPLVAPTEAVFRAIPMPPIAKRRGPFVLHPPAEGEDDKDVKSLFDPLGTLVEVQHEKDLKVLMATASLMAPYYYIMAQALEWMGAQGFSPKEGTRYLAALFKALAEDVMDVASAGDPASFDDITKASQTPGGLNEQNLRTLDERGFYSLMKETLNEILDRVKGSK